MRSLIIAAGLVGALTLPAAAMGVTTDAGGGGDGGRGAQVEHPDPGERTRLTPDGGPVTWRYHFPIRVVPPEGCVGWSIRLSGRTLVAVDPRRPDFRRQVFFSANHFSQVTPPPSAVKVFLNSYTSRTRTPQLPPGVSPHDIAEVTISGFCRPPGVQPTRPIDETIRIPISLTSGAEFRLGGAPPDPAPPSEPPADPSPSSGPARFALSAVQLLINQRIGQAAIRRLNAVEAMLDGRPAPSAGRRGAVGKVTLSAAQLLINQRIYQAGVRRANALQARMDGGPAPETARGRSGSVRLTVAQLRINQRIAQAAVRRANSLAERAGVR